MRFLIFFPLAATCLAHAVLSSVSRQSSPRKIPRANNLHFELDGETKYWAGTNAYWLPFLPNNADVDLVLDHMAEAQLRIVRTWGFNDIVRSPNNCMISMNL
jgi:mannan endo-1,4-beta-mannosidase